ncbi:hypothetical protein CDLVIII_5928 [Clostridium sp. DL-VIII]|uniref:hypothetical protein n=1 Tax=Clostridium sp. DL-VIII TaxID=641107 RepID=UPI00023B03DA|nr:hypothetical protein [Clostridium sp. DL-VIII]EHJ02391.1 hypothetical protein CDLVIII_5928 [Clostridium sp. DL-VIII]
MNKLRSFMIITEIKENCDKLENDRDYLLIKRKEHFIYDKRPIWRELKNYLAKNNESFKEVDIEQLDGRVNKGVIVEINNEVKELPDLFRYFSGKLLKLVFDEKNKVIKKYILHRGVVNQDYSEINKKFLTEIFNIKNGQDSYYRINNYIEFEVNNEFMNKSLLNYFEEDVIKINEPYEISSVDDFVNIKIDSTRVKEILKEEDDIKMTINLYSKVSVNIDKEMENNEIYNLKMNVINI